MILMVINSLATIPIGIVHVVALLPLSMMDVTVVVPVMIVRMILSEGYSSGEVGSNDREN
jgi:hypothetical protein